MRSSESYPTELVTYPTLVKPNGSLSDRPSPERKLSMQGLYMFSGLDEDLAEQLVERSREPHVAKFCPNDSGSRFKDLAAVERWQQRGRLAMPLARFMGGSALKLAGFGWMGPGVPGEDEPEIPGARITFAIRLYRRALGQGNALPYTQAMLGLHEQHFGNQGVWLEAWGDNDNAIGVYEDAGFRTVAETTGLRGGEEIPRLYMSLGAVAAG